jgi:hypothetical protein
MIHIKDEVYTNDPESLFRVAKYFNFLYQSHINFLSTTILLFSTCIYLPDIVVRGIHFDCPYVVLLWKISKIREEVKNPLFEHIGVIIDHSSIDFAHYSDVNPEDAKKRIDELLLMYRVEI